MPKHSDAPSDWENMSKSTRTYGSKDTADTCAKESFVPFQRTQNKFADTTLLQQMLELHGFVLVEPDVTYCRRNDNGDHNQEIRCEKGMLITLRD